MPGDRLLDRRPPLLLRRLLPALLSVVTHRPSAPFPMLTNLCCVQVGCSKPRDSRIQRTPIIFLDTSNPVILSGIIAGPRDRQRPKWEMIPSQGWVTVSMVGPLFFPAGLAVGRTSGMLLTQARNEQGGDAASVSPRWRRPTPCQTQASLSAQGPG